MASAQPDTGVVPCGRRRRARARKQKEIQATVLTLREETIIVIFRRRSLLPLNDCLYTRSPMASAVCKVEGGRPARSALPAIDGLCLAGSAAGRFADGW
jgi:hypothetical protein